MCEDDYDRITEGHHPSEVEIAVVIRHPNGEETTPAVFRNASVVLESAPHFTQRWTAHQLRITTTSGTSYWDGLLEEHGSPDRPGFKAPRRTMKDLIFRRQQIEEK